MLILGLARKSTYLLDAAARDVHVHIKDAASCAHCPHQHDVTAALSGLAAQKSMSKVLVRPSTQPVCMLDDATVHIEDAASCGYRYTTSTRL